MNERDAETASTSTRKLGRLPYRTSPETHSKIAQAAQQSGVSINAWMDRILSQAAEEQLNTAPADKPEQPPLLQTLLNTKSLANLVDDEFKPLLKSDRTLATLEFLSALQSLVTTVETMQAHVQGEGLNAAYQVIMQVDTLVKNLQPLTKLKTPESVLDLLPTFEGVIKSLQEVEICLKDDNSNNTQTVLKRIIQHMESIQSTSSVAAVNGPDATSAQAGTQSHAGTSSQPGLLPANVQAYSMLGQSSTEMATV